MTPPLGDLETWIREVVASEVERRLGHVQVLGEYMTTEEAGELARVAPGTIRRWIREGRLATQSAGRELRVKRSDLERLMSEGRKKPERSPEALAMDSLEAERKARRTKQRV